jgi:hypothetical protein
MSCPACIPGTDLGRHEFCGECGSRIRYLPKSAEESCQALCQSRKYETGEGTCALICLSQAGSARDQIGGCRYASQVFGGRIVQS